MLKFKIHLASCYLTIPIVFLLFPSFPTLLSAGGEQIVLFLEIITIVVLGILRVYRIRVESSGVLIYVTFFFYSTIFSLVCDNIKGVVCFRDYFELIKPFSFLLFFLFYRNSNIRTTKIESMTFKALKIVFLILIIYCILEFLFPDPVRNFSYLIYKRESVPILNNKAIGSFEQTYQFAFILLLPISYVYIRFLKQPSLLRFLIFAGFFFVLLLTQSRSMYFTFAVCLLVCLLLPFLYSSVQSTLRILLLIIAVASLATIIFISYEKELRDTFAYAFSGIESMASGSNNSVNTRAAQLDWALENNHFTIIGAGIGKEEMMLESFYSLYYYRYGILGIGLFLFLSLYTSLLSYRIAKNENDNNALLYYTLFVFYLITPMAIMSSCHQDTPKISLIFYGLIGLVHRKYGELKK